MFIDDRGRLDLSGGVLHALFGGATWGTSGGSEAAWEDDGPWFGGLACRALVDSGARGRGHSAVSDI